MTTTAWPTGERDVVIARIDAHRAADQIIQGQGWESGKGCAIGCSLDEYSHEEYCRVVLGESAQSLQLAKLIDHLHESLAPEQSLDWPGRVARALQTGADTTLALQHWLCWLLADELADYAEAQPMADLFQRSLGVVR